MREKDRPTASYGTPEVCEMMKETVTEKEAGTGSTGMTIG